MAYGATASGGSKGLGTVFKLALTPTGWKETVLHSFTGNSDGANPFIHCAGLAVDSLGNLYGTTVAGGVDNAGIVFKLTPQTSGAWTETILYTFKGGNDGFRPRAGVILDKSGDVFGTTESGGTGRYGTAFVLTAANHYAKAILHEFTAASGDGWYPNGLIFDASGNLYGTCGAGGSSGGGTIFKLTRDSVTAWSEHVLYNFTGGADGNIPFVPMTMDAHGRLYSSTIWGGGAGTIRGGVVFEFIP